MESSIAEFLKRQSACELLPTVQQASTGDGCFYNGTSTLVHVIML